MPDTKNIGLKVLSARAGTVEIDIRFDVAIYEDHIDYLLGNGSLLLLASKIEALVQTQAHRSVLDQLRALKRHHAQLRQVKEPIDDA